MDIFVGSLPFKLKENELRELFEKYGEVSSAKIIIDKETRQNKGFGFVEMPNEEEALKAIEALNGSEVMSRTIKVNKSEKREPGSGGSTYRGDGPRRPSFNRESTGTGGGNTFNRDSNNSGGYSRDNNAGSQNRNSSPGSFSRESSTGRDGFNKGSSNFGGGNRDGGGGFNKGAFKGDKNKDSKSGGFNKGGKNSGYPKKRRTGEDDDEFDY